MTIKNFNYGTSLKKENKENANKSKLIANDFKNKKNKIIEQPILNDEQIQDILDNIDFS